MNPSWEIAKNLPPFLPPPKQAAAGKSTVADHPPVRILVHPTPIRVAYKTVRELVPKLWEGRKIDYMIHIGMASGRRFYSVERRGHRDDYLMRDVDDQLLRDDERARQEGDKWVWNGVPDELLTGTNIDDIWRRWRAALPNIDVRISEDAGRYLCDFIYFSSLAHLYKKEEERRVLFLHVPVECDDFAVRKGVDITVELIRALIQSDKMKKLTRQPEI